MTDKTKLKNLITKEVDEDGSSDDLYDFLNGDFDSEKYIFHLGENKDLGEFITYIEAEGELYEGSTTLNIIKYNGNFYAIPYYFSSWGESDLSVEELYQVEQIEKTIKTWVPFKNKKKAK